MAITNMRAFSNKVKKQFHMNYSILPSEVTTNMVEYIAEIIHYSGGNHAILTDYLYTSFPTEHGMNKAQAVAADLLT